MFFAFNIFCLPQGQIKSCWDTNVLRQPGQCVSFGKGRTIRRKVAIPLLISHFFLFFSNPPGLQKNLLSRERISDLNLNNRSEEKKHFDIWTSPMCCFHQKNTVNTML